MFLTFVTPAVASRPSSAGPSMSPFERILPPLGMSNPTDLTREDKYGNINLLRIVMILLCDIDRKDNKETW